MSKLRFIIALVTFFIAINVFGQFSAGAEFYAGYGELINWQKSYRAVEKNWDEGEESFSSGIWFGYDYKFLGIYSGAYYTNINSTAHVFVNGFFKYEQYRETSYLYFPINFRYTLKFRNNSRIYFQSGVSVYKQIKQDYYYHHEQYNFPYEVTKEIKNHDELINRNISVDYILGYSYKNMVSLNIQYKDGVKELFSYRYNSNEDKKMYSNQFLVGLGLNVLALKKKD
jgi:hypothetical protein